MIGDNAKSLGLDEAISMMKVAFSGIKDRGGHPYELHCLAVMERVRDRLPLLDLSPEAEEDLLIAAVCHDMEEDTPYGIDFLRGKGAREPALEILRLVSRNRHPGKSYQEWIDVIAMSGNLGAIVLKHEDNAENSTPERIANLPPEMRSIQRRYERSMARLEAAAPFLASPPVARAAP